jgi:cupin fold WbuC family metalloprotein
VKFGIVAPTEIGNFDRIKLDLLGFSQLLINLPTNKSHKYNLGIAAEMSLFLLSGSIEFCISIICNEIEYEFTKKLTSLKLLRFYGVNQISISNLSNSDAHILISFTHETRSCSTESLKETLNTFSTYSKFKYFSKGILKYEKPNVFRTQSPNGRVNNKQIKILKKSYSNDSFSRKRICIHQKDTSSLHEMIIYFKKPSALPPLIHTNKDESFFLLEGLAKYIELNSNGEIINVINLVGYFDKKSWKDSFCTIKANTIHYLLIDSPNLLVKETTLGPFEDKHLSDPEKIFSEFKFIEPLSYKNVLNKGLSQ